MGRPIRATIRLSALRSNLALARGVAPQVRQLAVIKANAYGHGLLRAAGALRDADGFAVVDLDDAVRLRQAGHKRRILLLEGFFDPLELPCFCEEALTAVVHSPEQIRMLEQARLASSVDVFLKVNSGMNRLGLPADTLRSALHRLQASGNVGEITFMTHFANADDARGIQWQLEVFQRATAGLDLPVSTANSAALLRYAAATQGWARPGIMLYGASPFADQSAAELGLLPAMTLESNIIAVQSLVPGDRVGYGGAFTADHRMRIGVVACGYADGYPRHADSGTPVLVNGRRTGTVGRVSMDMLCADLTHLPDSGLGSPVVLWGEGMPVEQVAAAAGTVSYELLCALAPRVPTVEAQ
ncbi:MAG TPA: alanine racemase [Burkholderiales bacterium]|nr:alanine racemase [Burkholderiales bacterium]